ncbi:ABC transporter permease [Fusibacter paucivorans]|uniref:ABC transporter permease n=1 Tax=Fusibacter paucivorans TaxID=76009 RepID=A0ABS5PUE3_9FIRM|nr:nickel transporter permease [Fusibacter paucivorans]MBS7527657.1 ABC transporter permease [Fusibacter paucivorans]
MSTMSVSAAKKIPKKKSRFAETSRLFAKNRLAVIGLIVLILLALVAIFSNQIAPYGEDEQNLRNTLQTPSAEHIMGTDNLGRDVFSRIVYGSRISLVVGFISVGIGLAIGGGLGAIAGYFGGRSDNIIMRVFDMMMAIPSMILAIAICAALGPGMLNTMIAVGFSTVPNYARVVRSAVLTVKQQEFIEAAHATGSSNVRIILKHILPNCLAPIIVQASLGVAGAILSAASMSFIGLGVQPPTAEWGGMLSAGRTYVRNQPHLVLFPGIAIMMTIFSLNLVGDGLRDALDPRLKR